MSTSIGLPDIDVKFEGRGVSAVRRGQKGVAVLVVQDETQGTPAKYYKTIEDFGSEEQEKFTESNIQLIKDAFEGVPLKLYVFKIKSEDIAEDVLRYIGGRIPRNCWIGTTDKKLQASLVSWIKAKNKSSQKRYKALVYKAIGPDSRHVVNFVNDKVRWAAEERGEATGDQAVPYLLGLLAGLSMNISATKLDLTKFESVSDIDEPAEGVNNGEFILTNEEGVVKVARAVNSRVTLGQYVTEKMCHINTVEKMDLIYCDIVETWKKDYGSGYPNELGNQMLLIGAINGYYKTLAKNHILDKEFPNRAAIDVETQRIANYPEFGEEVCDSWDELKVKKMVVGTKVFLRTRFKITGIMEDFYMPIEM